MKRIAPTNPFAFTKEELAMLAKLEERAIVSIEQTNWTGEPLNENERQLISMTVSWVYARFREGLNRADE